MSMIMNVMKNAIDVGKKEKHHIDGKKQVVKKQRDVEDVGRQKGKKTGVGFVSVRNSNHFGIAEVLAIKKACKKLDAWRLLDCEMYVTLEPCPMCAGAIINSRISKIYIGTDDEKTGACGSKLNLLEDYKFNHNVQVQKYILKEECSRHFERFF